MRFVLQQPGTGKLITEIGNAAVNSDSGGGVFAFASKDGIDTLLGSEHIIHMLQNGRPFRLIVGVDAVTNAAALLSIQSWLESFPATLTVEVFYHQNQRSIFHPKFCWFENGENLYLITGSGNLTLRGLGQNDNVPSSGNWEAFTVQSLTGSSKIETLEEINNWLTEQTASGRLRSHQDEHVRNKAMANSRVRFYSHSADDIEVSEPEELPGSSEQEPITDVVLAHVNEVLIREIPSNRSGQADVGKEVLTHFFGYQGQSKNVFVQHVSLNNELGPAEPARMFVNSSDNYRLELRAITEFDYEVGVDGSRMVVVAVKLDQESFRYTIVPVTAEDYQALSDLLGQASTRPGRPMRKHYIVPNRLKEIWSNMPSNLLPLEQYTVEP